MIPETQTYTSTKFFTNSGDNSLLKKFRGAFSHIADLYAFHAVAGYFRASGYFAIREHLMQVPEVKILVGINVDALSAEAKRRGLLFFGDPEKCRDEFVREMRQDIESAAYNKETEEGILQFMTDIVEGRVQIRVHKTKKLHAKIYIFLPRNFNEYSGGEVITGSSNLTEAGLGIRHDSNHEFNVALRDFEDVRFAEEEFQKLWKEGEEVLPADAARMKQRTHLETLFTPFEIYLKLLIEYFGKNIEYDPSTVGDLPQNFKRLTYQVDAVNEGYQMLLRHNGFMLADVVGLGKTVIATVIAKRFLIANGALNTKILVVYPPAVEKSWKATFRQFGLDKHTRFVTNGSLHKILEDNEDYWPKEDYDLIIVDEAHKFRNHTSEMFDRLQTICKTRRSIIGGVPGERKKVMLVSATPLNNRPEDIYYQLQLFQNVRKSTLPGEPNLQSFFGPLLKRYAEIRKQAAATGKPDVAALRSVYERIRARVLEPLTVRRTRTDIKKFPAYLKDLEEQGIVFPEIAPPGKVEYKMHAGLEDLFYRTIDALVDGTQLSYFRYQAIAYLKSDIKEKFGYTQAELISRSLAFIMRTSMVKRLESSFHAFRKSLSRLLTATERMIQMFEKGKVYVVPGKKINELMDKGWTDEEIERLIEELSIQDSRNQIYSPDDFTPDFLPGLIRDRDTLAKICAEWDKVDEDPKLDEFFKLLELEAFRKDLNPTGKLVVFTESAETAEYLTEKLKSQYPRLLSISAANRSKLHDVIRANFDANLKAKEQSEDYDIIITTEVLAEGVNLHRSNTIVNYDTPWNAARLMQRLGRVNRIGSVAPVIYHYSFYPSHQSKKYIQIYQNAFIKLQGFHTAYGEDAQIYTVEEVLEQVRLHTQGVGEEEDRRLHHLKVIRDFRAANEKEFRRIEKLPLKARTGRIPLAQHKALKAGSLVFMKSPYKHEFYQVDAAGIVQPLTFLQAADLFAASPDERPQALPPAHYDHIARAEHQFEQELLTSTADTVSGDGADARTGTARKFLRELRAGATDDKLRDAIATLMAMLETGEITRLPNELKKLKGRLDKDDLKPAAVETLVIALATKYSSRSAADENEDEGLPSEVWRKAQVIISETFTTYAL